MVRNHIVAAIGIGASILFAASHQASAQIKIGAASFLGDPEKKTLEMYVDAINAKGGVNGQKLVSSSTTTAAMPTMRAPSPRAWSRKTRSRPWSAAPRPARQWR